jgi:hypothetical protein
MKNVWISALTENQPRVAAVTTVLKRYGLNCTGHFWSDAPEKLSWKSAMTALQDAKADLWLILADEAQMNKPSIRYGLSLMAASLRQVRGTAFQIVFLWDTAAPASVTLPQLLRSATQTEEAAASWPAKIVARANMPAPMTVLDYRLDILGDERLGQWFEIGPTEGVWNGVMLGVCGEGAEINFQAVGSAGTLPEKTTLEYAQNGLKIQAGDREFIASAVRNVVDKDSSYFVRIKGCPQAILFMPYVSESDGDDTTATIVHLQ